jgi:glycosyl transferase family 1
VKTGLFGARADDRGLGRLTHDFYRHMTPERTLVIDMAGQARGFTQHLERYPGERIVEYNGGRIAERVMREFFTGLDVAVFYETPYDPRAYDIAREVGCRSVLMVMPEFHRHLVEPDLPRPDAWWIPTGWRAETVPGARVVPVPVTLDEAGSSGEGEEPRILHVAGHRTTGDRNGTGAFLDAVARLPAGAAVSVRVTTQDSRLAHRPGPGGPGIWIDAGGRADHRDLYRGADVLVMPRRYGGLCLPVQEAMAAGLGVVMTDCPPNMETWPVLEVRARAGRPVPTPAGAVETWDADVGVLARTIADLADDPGAVAVLRVRAREWAAAHTWEALAGRYRAELEAVRGDSPVSRDGMLQGRT